MREREERGEEREEREERERDQELEICCYLSITREAEKETRLSTSIQLVITKPHLQD